MAGYNNYSMSNNAVIAYLTGEKPRSKWTKTEIVEEIKKVDKTFFEKYSQIEKVKVSILKDYFLRNSSWHHTSKYYNKTDFYSIDIDYIESFTEENYLDIIKANSVKKETPQEDTYTATFNVWGGTRKHPKVVGTKTFTGIVKNGWMQCPDGHKRNIYANSCVSYEKQK